MKKLLKKSWCNFRVFFVWLLLIIAQKAIAQKFHPYLFYTPERTDHLKERLKTDTVLANSWDAIKQRCDEWVSKDKGGNAEQLAFAYTMTGNKTYASRAKVLLMDIVNKQEWDGMDDRTPRWNAGLNTSHTNWIASVAFDAIYNSLSKDERKDIANKIVKLGIEPCIKDWISKDKRLQSLNSMGHNWWAAVVFGAGNACLAVMDEIPEARQWAANIMEDSEEWFAFQGSVLENKIPSFDPDGGFYESVGYASYGISEYLQFRVAYTNALGGIKMPYDELLQKTADWFINDCYPRTGGRLMSLNFGDSNDFATGETPLKLLVALGLGKSEYYWYLNQTVLKANGSKTLADPISLLYQPENKSSPTVPFTSTSAIYSTMGWGMLRDSWKPNSTMLGVKCGFTWNHSHADAGSFVLYHNGQNLLIDGGDVNYANDAYSDYFVTSRAHNVMMFNGVAQDPQDQYHAVKTPGHLYNMMDGGNLKYILADATGPTSRNFLRNYRNFLWIGSVILIMDDVHTYDIGQFDFLLHYADTAVKRGPDLEITNKDAAILFRPLYPEMLPLGYPHDLPEKMKFRTEHGLKDRTVNVKIPYYVLTPPDKSDRTKFINAIILLDENNKSIQTATGSSGASGAAGRSNLPVIEKFESTEYLGIRIKQNGQVTEIYFNLLADGRLMHRNSIININGYETDAYITALTFPDNADKSNPTNLSSYFMANGSFLRKDDKSILSSLSKVFIYATKDGGNLNVQLQGQPLMNVSLRPEKINKLTVNSKTVAPKYDKDKMLLIEINKTTE